jgi:TnpA family transposase
MRQILTALLGSKSFPRQLSDFEIREFFTLKATERRAIRMGIRGRLRLPVALQVGFLHMTGTTLDAFDYIPREVLAHLGKQLHCPSPMLATLRGLYRRHRTLFRHQAWALEHLGMHRYGVCDAQAIADMLTAETRATVDRDRLAVRVRDALYVRRCCLPSERVVADAVPKALRAVERADARALRSSIPERYLTEWIRWAMAPRPDGMSWLEWVRRPPGRRGAKTLRMALGKLQSLRGLPGFEPARIPVPPERLRAYGRRLRRRKPAHFRRIVEPRRSLELVGFLTTTLASEADRTLRLVEMRINQIWRWAHRVSAEAGRPSIPREEGLLTQLLDLVDDPTVSDQAYRAHAKARLYEWSAARSPARSSRAARVREVLAAESRRIRPLLKDMLALGLEAVKGDDLIHSLNELQVYYREGWLDLHQGAIVPYARAWQRLVDQPDREAALGAFEAATLWGIRKGLRNGSLFLSYAREYRGKERLLLPAITWSEQRRVYCERRHLPEAPEPFIARVMDQIRLGLKALEEAVTAQEVSVKANGIHLKDDPNCYTEPGDSDELRQRLYTRVGRVQLPELLLSVDSESRFSWQLLGREPSSADELITVYAALLAAASNLDAKTMAMMIPGQRPSAVRRAMMLLEEESALRRANNAVAEALRSIPLVAAWGSGYEASSDMVSLDTSRHLWASRVDPKRRRHAIGTYVHVLDQWGIVYDQPLLLATRQAGAAIEGAIRQSITRIERVAVDTHGYTDFALACAKLLGFDLCPRLRSMRDRKLHVPRSIEVPEAIAAQVVQDVSPVSIREHWSELLRVVATIEEGWSSATQLLERFGNAARGEEVYRAGTALGQLLRTIYLCDYFTLPQFRREIHRILDRGESVHALQRAIHIGAIPVARGREAAGLGVISGALTLVANAVMLWNAARLQKAVDAEVLAGTSRAISIEALSHIGPVAYAHINFRGTYKFPIERYAGRLLRAA